MRFGYGRANTARPPHRGLAATWALALATGATQASPITFVGSSGHRAASTTFEVFGDDLVITLTNTSTTDVRRPTDVLTALFFDVKSPTSLNLTRESAVLGAGAIVLFGSAPGGVVGGEWAYKKNIDGPNGQNYGISSTGLDIFGSSGRFPGANLQGPSAVDGLQFGITSAGDDPASGNTPVTGSNGLIKHQVVFTLSGLPHGFDPSTKIKDVVVQYGTDLCDPRICLVVPESTTLAFVTLGGLTLARRRRR